MLFNSIEFVVFLPLFCLAYFCLRNQLRPQNLLIVVGSYVFYAWWDVRFLLLIAISTAVDFIAALMIEHGQVSRKHRLGVSLFVVVSAAALVGVTWSGGGIELFSTRTSIRITVGCLAAVLTANALYEPIRRLAPERRRRTCLTISIVVNLLILGVFKYFDFFASALADITNSLLGFTPSNWTLGVVLPVGISFYTFQTMSYSIDVYRGRVRSSGEFLNVAAYVAFFPQLVAGPIERAYRLLPQFARRRPRLTPTRFRRSAWLITWGLFKKLVVADNMALIVNGTFAPYDQGVYAIPDDGLTLLVGVYAFAFQIYGDFSGYTDIARGVAKLLGFELMHNFNLPYFATSPSEFWKRWHISLSSWLQDYLYIPLGGNRMGALVTYRNLFLTMLLGGLWHGAAWNFVIWGAYHGALLSAYKAAGGRFGPGAKSLCVRVFLTIIMFHFTCLGWLIFRASDLSTITAMLEGIVLNPHASEETWTDLLSLMRFGWILVVFQFAQLLTKRQDPLESAHWFIRLNVWVIVLTSLLAMSARSGQEFIYFAF